MRDYMSQIPMRLLSFDKNAHGNPMRTQMHKAVFDESPISW